MGLLSKVFSNARKPEGWLGRMMVNGMNGGTHAAMATWGIGMAGVPVDGDILVCNAGAGLPDAAGWLWHCHPACIRQPCA